MGKIATEQEAYNIGGTKDGLFVANKCCTKERAEIMGCDVNEDYDSNKLVEIEDLTVNPVFSCSTLKAEDGTDIPNEIEQGIIKVQK